MQGEDESTIIMQRRQCPRLKVAIPMFVRGMDQPGRQYLDFATVLNISSGGCLLVLHRALPPGAEISLEIPIGLVPLAVEPKLVRYIQAQLLRIEPSERFFVVAVQFITPLPA